MYVCILEIYCIDSSPKFSKLFSFADLLLAKLTCNISACGVCTKYDAFPLGADCKQSWPSVATGLYMKTIALDNFPSYRTYRSETI